MPTDTRFTLPRVGAAILTGLALSLTACGGTGVADPRSARTVREMMVPVVDPAADAIWGAVEIVVTFEGKVEKQPRTDEEWAALRRHAETLAEASRLLRTPNLRVARPGEIAGDPRIDLDPEEIQRRIDGDPALWTSHTRALQSAATVTLQAIATKNVKALVDAGEVLDQACEACHQTYWYRPSPEPVHDPPPRPQE
jgi:hypothetical protein